MDSINKKALFIINSPFQSLCMFEAIQHYGINDYDVILRPDSIEKNNEMLASILSSRGVAYRIVKMNHIIKDVLPYIFKRKTRYNCFYIGDYYSGGIIAYIYSLIYASKGASITYLDDGTLTLNVFQEPPVPRAKNWKVAALVKVYEIIKVLKRIKEPTFFTIFNVQSDKYRIEKNELQTLRNKIGNAEQIGVYIIGTNFYDQRDSFLSLLSNVIDYLRREYPAHKIYYCPHRRNVDNDELYQLLDKEDVSLFETKVSVEYDFAENCVNPKVIFAFGSTAVFTLKMIYPKSNVYNYNFMINDEGYIKTFESLAKELGVQSLDRI